MLPLLFQVPGLVFELSHSHCTFVHYQNKCRTDSYIKVLKLCWEKIYFPVQSESIDYLFSAEVWSQDGWV